VQSWHLWLDQSLVAHWHKLDEVDAKLAGQQFCRNDEAIDNAKNADRILLGTSLFVKQFLLPGALSPASCMRSLPDNAQGAYCCLLALYSWKLTAAVQKPR
jgi:hypothetical protein